jgi:hypothetical protein
MSDGVSAAEERLEHLGNQERGDGKGRGNGV